MNVCNFWVIMIRSIHLTIGFNCFLRGCTRSQGILAVLNFTLLALIVYDEILVVQPNYTMIRALIVLIYLFNGWIYLNSLIMCKIRFCIS